MDDAAQIANRTDLSAYWMPFTANRQFKAAPRMVVSASGMYYQSDDGRQILDGTAGLWCVNAGHGRAEIAAAVHHQLMSLDYASSFNAGHPLAFDFATRLAKIAPPGLDRVFYSDSGSTSVEIAIKMAYQYWHQRGGQHVRRTSFVNLTNAYHGDTVGSVSVGGIDLFHSVYEPLLFSTHQVKPGDTAELARILDCLLYTSDAADE